MKNEDNNTPDNLFGEVIYSYTREDAFNDGFLVDVTVTAKEAGFSWPVAMTRPLYEDSVAWDNDDEDVHQDESGRLWDVLWMAQNAIRNDRDGGNTLKFGYLRIPRGETEAKETVAKLIAGPGDSGEPVITLMLPEED